MRVIRRGPAILGDRLFRAFLRSLRLADLAEATRRGYAGDLRRFGRWIEETRGARARLAGSTPSIWSITASTSSGRKSCEHRAPTAKSRR